MNKIYLCGPINGCTDDEARGWRVVASEAIAAAGHASYDPMVRDYRGRELEPGIATEIVELDKQDIDNCTHILVMFDKPSVGTSMEVLYAWERGIPVHVVNLSSKPLSPWLIYHSAAIHPTLISALEALA